MSPHLRCSDSCSTIAERERFGSLIRAGDAVLDLGAVRFTAPLGRSVLLTSTAVKILECLMRNANAVVSCDALFERTWGCEDDGGVTG